MSGTSNNTPVYTITIGTAGAYNNDSGVDMASTINHALAAAPEGATIDLVFEPGNYALASTILLPSNTNVIGNGATLSILKSSTVSFNGTALMANADAHFVGNTMYENNDDGTQTVIPYNSLSTVSMTTNSNTAIVDSNIAISDLVFNESGNALDTSKYSDVNQDNNVFGTWFTNSRNIVVQDNVYIGGNDANAFVNVVNGVVANNIAVGQLSSYDNWNGPVNLTIENNESWQYSANEHVVGNGSTQINPTPTGDPTNPGTGSNDAIIENLYAGDSPGILGATSILPLEVNQNLVIAYDMTQQGNVDDQLDTPDASSFYIYYIQDSITEDNLVSQAVITSGADRSIMEDINWGPSLSTNGTFIGNLIFGAFTAPMSNASVLDQGVGSNLTDNAILSANALASNAFSANSLSGNIDNSGTISDGSGTSTAFAISAPPNIILTNANSIVLSGTLAPEIIDLTGTSLESVTLTTQFGLLTLESTIANVTTADIGGEAAIIVTGSLAAVDQALASLEYTPNENGDSDSIKIVANNSNGSTATRYIPIIAQDDTPTAPNVITLGSGFLNTIQQLSTLYPNQQLPSMATLTGEILIANGSNNILNMGSTISLAFLGAGSSTVQGGSKQEFIETGTGSALLNLTGAGDITVEGGAGPLRVNAQTSISSAADLIQTGNSDATVTGGAGALSVVGGLGNLTFNGGSGLTYLATLPADGGGLQANLGSGNSTVFALSGNSTITTESGTTNYIQLGLGATSIRSAGNDTLVLGVGSVIIDALPGGTTRILSGGALITYIDDDSSSGNGELSASAAVLAIGGTNGSSISGAAAPAEVRLLASGAIIAASGALSVQGGALNDTVIGGAGLLTFNQGQSSSGAMVLDGSGGALVDFTGGADTFLGGAGAASVTETNASAAYFTLGSGGGSIALSNVSHASIVTSAATSSTVSASEDASDNTMISSFGKDTVTVGGNATVNAYTGSSDAIHTSGAAFVNVYAGSSDTISATGTLDLNLGLGSSVLMSKDSVTLYDGIATISASNLARADVSAQQSRLNFINTSILPQTVSGGAGGSVTVSGGPGGGMYTGGGAGNNLLLGGTGVVTLIGGGSGDYLQANSALGVNVLSSGTGGETLVASSTTVDNDFIVNPNGNDNVVSQGSGVQTFVLRATTGDTATLTGSSAANAYNIFDIETDNGYDGASYILRNFNSNSCVIDLTNANGTGAPDCSVSTIEADPSGSGGSLILLSNQTSILIQNYNPTQLSVSVGNGGLLAIH